MAERKQIKPEVDRFEHGWESPRLHWSRDGHRFAYEQVDRGHQRLRVIEVDAHTGAVRNLIDEKSETFIWTAHTENLRLNRVNWLEKTDEIIYASERDGWRRLYLVDAGQAKVKTQITKGEYVVRFSTGRLPADPNTKYPVIEHISKMPACRTASCGIKPRRRSIPPSYKLVTGNWKLVITNHQPPITNHQLPITNYRLRCPAVPS